MPMGMTIVITSSETRHHHGEQVQTVHPLQIEFGHTYSGLLNVSDGFHQILMLVAILRAHRLCRLDKHRFIDVVELHAAGLHFRQRTVVIRIPQLALLELRFASQRQDLLLFVSAQFVPFHFGVEQHFRGDEVAAQRVVFGDRHVVVGDKGWRVVLRAVDHPVCMPL